MKKQLHLPFILLIMTAYIACNKPAPSYNSDTSWINKKDLTISEIIDSVKSDIEHTKYFKYTSANSANVNFYGGQKTNTFLLDRKGNAFSSRNREQNFLIDGKMYTRMIGLREEGLVATVISDVLEKSTLDEDYFDRNIPYVIENGIVNIKMLRNCLVTISVSGGTITIKTTDFENIDAKDTEYITDLTATYTPHKESKLKVTYVKDGETIIRTYTFILNPNEEVKLPTLMKIGEKLSAEK